MHGFSAGVKNLQFSAKEQAFLLLKAVNRGLKMFFFLVIAGCFWIMNRARPQRWSLPLKVLKMGFNDYNNDIIIGAGTQ